MTTPEIREPKPYVRYQITASIADKGIAYSIKRAASAFLTAQGYSGRVSDLKASSDHLDAVLELFDNGKPDFNIVAFQGHIESSGRLPTNVNLKPKVTITPIPVDKEIVITQENESLIAYQRKIAELGAQVEERDRSICGLTNTLTERQKAISEKEKRMTDLESRLSTQEPTQFGTAREAIQRAYLKSGTDVLMNTTLDLDELITTGNVDYFISADRKNLNFTGYVAKAFGVSIKDDGELTFLVAEARKYPRWEETETGKAVNAELRRLDANQSVLETAVKNGAGLELIAILRKAVSGDAAQKMSLTTTGDGAKERFAKQRMIADNFENLQRRYASLVKVVESSEKRQEEGAELPLLVQLNDGKTPTIDFVLPVIGYGGEYEAHLFKLAKEDTEEQIHTEGVVVSTSKNDNFSLMNINPDVGEIAGFQEKVGRMVKTLVDDPLTKALGVKLKVSCLSEV